MTKTEMTELLELQHRIAELADLADTLQMKFGQFISYTDFARDAIRAELDEKDAVAARLAALDPPPSSAGTSE